jgi:hypothetical protein
MYLLPMIGQPIINGSVCSSEFISIRANETTRNGMAPYALQLPKPVNQSCTVDSLDPSKQQFLLYKVWQFEYTYYVSYRDGKGDIAARIEFLVYNIGQDVMLRCDGWDGRLNRNQTLYDPNFWFDCAEEMSIWQTELDVNHHDTRYARANYDAVSNTLSLNMSWFCDDKNPDRP